jgi:hypothetical protein
LSEFGDALGGHNRARLEQYMEVVNLEEVVWEGGKTGAVTLFISYIGMVGMQRIKYKMVCRDRCD